MKIIRISIGIIILLSVVPLLIWSAWDYNYTPQSNYMDKLLNSVHPFVAGIIVELLLLSFILMLIFSIYLINPKLFKR